MKNYIIYKEVFVLFLQTPSKKQENKQEHKVVSWF
jgi:hypothetical protein